MNCRLLSLFLLSLATLLPARAEGPDDLYLRVYELIQKADAMESPRQDLQALSTYLEAQTALQKFQKSYPNWNPQVVRFRENYLQSKVEALSAKTPATARPATGAPVGESARDSAPSALPAAASPGAAEAQVADLQGQVRQLLADKTILESKLKEALAAQPASVDPRELAKAEENAKALQKENELLKVSLEQAKTRPPQTATSTNVHSESATLRARLAVLEARQVPYTAEELALFNRPGTQVAPAASPKTPKKPSVDAAPAGALSAEAQRYFSAKQYEQAEEKYSEALKLDPNNVVVLANLAAVQLERNRLPEAEKNITRALTLAPEDAYGLSVMGYLKFRQEKFDDALDALSRAEHLNPQSAEIENFLGLTLSHKGLRVAAETALRRAVLLEPTYASAHNNLAVIYISQQPPAVELARWHYQKALSCGLAPNPELEKALDAKK